MSAVDRGWFWRIAATGWRTVLPTVLVHGLVQALLVSGDPVPMWSWEFAALTAASTAAVLAMVWLISCTIGTAAQNAAGRALVVVRLFTLGWSATVVGLILIAATWRWWAALILLVAGTPVLAESGSGSRQPVRAAVNRVRCRPWRAVSAAICTVLGGVMSAAVGLASGFFITGPAAAAITWTWAGLSTVLVLATWSYPVEGSPPSHPVRSGIEIPLTP